MDSYTPFGYANEEYPEPFDPTVICKKCSAELKQKFIEGFKKGNYKLGHWSKSRAEVDLKKTDQNLADIFLGRSEEIQKEIINQMKEKYPLDACYT